MSNLLVQNIKHTNNTTSMAIDTSGQVSVRGEGSATTTKLQQGLAKAFSTVDQTSGASIDDSNNISGITDNRTGEVGLSFSNNMNNTLYSVTVSEREHNADGNWVAGGFVVGAQATSGWNGTLSTSQYTVVNYVNNGAAHDSENSSVVHGDLA